MTGDELRKMLDSMRHALGLNRQSKPYRNYFCDRVSPRKEIKAAVSKGLMRAGHKINDGRDRYYFVTDAGAAVLGVRLPS